MSLAYFKHDKTGLIKEAPVGFSWTTLFFGFFVPIFRGAWLLAIICILVSVITAGIAWLVFPFIINKLYVKHLLETGYQPRSQNDVVLLSQIGIVVDSLKVAPGGIETQNTPAQIAIPVDTTKLRRTILGGLLGLPIGFVFYLSTIETKFMMIFRIYVTRDERPSVAAFVIVVIFFVAICALLGRELGDLGSFGNKSKK